jgi:integrase/recombinase XerD
VQGDVQGLGRQERRRLGHADVGKRVQHHEVVDDALEEAVISTRWGPALGCMPLRGVLAKTKRHNPDLDRSVIALRLGHESVETTQMYLHPELRRKEEALSKVTPLDVLQGRFRC